MERYRQTYLKENAQNPYANNGVQPRVPRSREPSLTLTPERSATSFGRLDYGLHYGQSLTQRSSIRGPLSKPSAASPANASVRYLSSSLEDNLAAVYNTYTPDKRLFPQDPPRAPSLAPDVSQRSLSLLSR
eukprot:CAMPEP_0118942674 /NCGR_PEP_ID=MMETSP1169-20130426/36614_1 /TAXON_ID=36882 /ORGANISM="Pyramimonas obovata, Strain CCMP722" /LENGTH=130 /DNA_ID=CAMNT_0006887729 /DNA_START=377 /DNA_END=765 /DNA_ORIENTATION=+